MIGRLPHRMAGERPYDNAAITGKPLPRVLNLIAVDAECAAPEHLIGWIWD